MKYVAMAVGLLLVSLMWAVIFGWEPPDKLLAVSAFGGGVLGAAAYWEATARP